MCVCNTYVYNVLHTEKDLCIGACVLCGVRVCVCLPECVHFSVGLNACGSESVVHLCISVTHAV